jgi:hypothetical protein
MAIDLTSEGTVALTKAAAIYIIGTAIQFLIIIAIILLFWYIFKKIKHNK